MAAFAVGSAITLAVGLTLLLPSRGGLESELSIRQAFVLTPASSVAVALFGAISGLNTTGSTVIVGLDAAPPRVLLWRALLQWLGGIGIIATVIAILPALRIGGMQLFRTESSDGSEKVLPRVRDIAMATGAVYLGLTLTCALAYHIAELSPFEAVAHALTTVSTGGYSTSDSSICKFAPPCNGSRSRS